jgi:hypothetical protein
MHLCCLSDSTWWWWRWGPSWRCTALTLSNPIFPPTAHSPAHLFWAVKRLVDYL